MGYTAYIETENKYIPLIPSEWSLKSGKLCFSENKEKNIELRERTLLQFTYGTIVRKKNQSILAEDEDIYRKYTVVQQNDIMLNGLNLNYDFISQRVGIVNEPGAITSAYLCLRCRDSVKPKFANYMLKALDAQKIFHGMGSGVRLTLGYSEFSKIQFAIPSIAEQDQIVRYLDWQVSKINKLIHGYQKQIRLVKEIKSNVITNAILRGIDEQVEYKDSGSKWLGKIPAHWKCLRGKYVFHEIDFRSETGEEELLSVSHITGVTPRSQKNVTMFKSESLKGYKICDIGDIAGNTMWMWQGAVAVSKYHGVISPSYNTYRQNNGVYVPEYLDYLLRTPNLIDNYIVLSTGIRKSRLRLYPDKFLSILYPVPSIGEQIAILDYIGKSIEMYDSQITMHEKQIELLKEYRTRLISDVVTGQKDVRDIIIPDYETEMEYMDEESDTDDMESEVSGDE